MTDHIVQSFDVELRGLTSHILELGILAEQQLTDAVWSLRRGNEQMAKEVAEREERLNRLAAQIDSDAVSMIARRQPLAIDLRQSELVQTWSAWAILLTTLPNARWQ